MKIQRRDFLKWGVANAVVLGTASKTTRAQGQTLARSGCSILQGATDATQTQFSILHKVSQKIEVFVTNAQGQRYEVAETQEVLFRGHPEQITKAFFTNLVPNETYYLNVIEALSKKTMDLREFSTLDTSKSFLRFTLCSCMKETEHEPEIWRTMVQKKPDMIFFVGDSVYADSGAPSTGADPAHLWKRFCEVRNTLEIYYSKKLIPILATWDDHDFGLNDTNCHEYPYVQESQKNFLDFFAQDPKYCSLLERGPGVSSAFRFQTQLFLLLDDRSYRDVKGSKDRFAHWGREQETWMLDLIRRNSGPSWMMNGSQIFPGMPFKESVSEDHPMQFAGLKSELRKLSSKVIFASGDVHYSEISRIESSATGYETFELTSSSIHSKSFPGVPDIIRNDRRIAGTGKRNYILVESMANAYGTDFTATSYDSDGQIRFQKTLKV